MHESSWLVSILLVISGRKSFWITMWNKNRDWIGKDILQYFLKSQLLVHGGNLLLLPSIVQQVNISQVNNAIDGFCEYLQYIWWQCGLWGCHSSIGGVFSGERVTKRMTNNPQSWPQICSTHYIPRISQSVKFSAWHMSTTGQVDKSLPLCLLIRKSCWCYLNRTSCTIWQ